MSDATNAQTKRALVVFVKSPVPGEVKTRLIPHLSAVESADLYKSFVSDTLRNAAKISVPARTVVAYRPHSKALDLSWLPAKNRPELFKQDGHSLGEKLIHAFGLAFGRGAQQVVIIGSDSPNLPPSYIDQGFRALADADVAIGPSTDGGYYLIGLSRPCLKLFDDVSWSTDQVFERTVQNAQRQGYRLKILPTHYDIDTFDDLLMLGDELEKASDLAPATHRYLAALKRNKQLIPAV